MFSLGLDIGYSAVKVAVIGRNGVEFEQYSLHGGRTVETALRLLGEVRSRFGEDNVSTGAIVGSGADYLVDSGVVSAVNEVAVMVEGALVLEPACRAIVEIGGQNAKYITGFAQQGGGGVDVSMNPSCSSGTGSFLEEQVSRLGISIEEYADYAARARSVPRIAGRCSVFAKTDITHHQQEGVPVEDILAGLGLAVMKNFRTAVMRGMRLTPPVLFVGGVARNKAMIDSLRQVLKLNEDQVLVHAASGSVAAIGAARLAEREGLDLNLVGLMERLDNEIANPKSQVETLLPILSGHGDGDSHGKHSCVEVPEAGAPLDCWLGIDVGSTSTNLVLADRENGVIGYRYLRTKGDPAGAVRTGLDELQREFGGGIRVGGVGVTGSGRYMIARLVGGDVIRDEITAQARAAVLGDPDVDTVIEIGGQDSKFIRLENGGVTDFQMNKVCAAGTGSFIEEQTKKLGVTLNKIGEVALGSSCPIDLGERCTVFMETSIAAHMAKGAQVDDLAAGLCHAIVRNYLHKVVGQKKLGDTILLQGGVAHNQGIINAFRAVTGRKVSVCPFFSVTGALGAAILAREEMVEGASTVFKGFSLQAGEVPAAEVFPEKKAVSTFSRTANSFIFNEYDGRLDSARKTVGIPRTLFTFMMFPLFNTIFKELGFNVLLSDPTSEKTVAMAQEHSLGETCYPVKLINGHVAELAERGVDYVFFPDLYTAYHPESKCRQNYGCPYMQIAFKIVSQAVDLSGKGVELLSPTFAYSLGPEFMRKSFMSMAPRLGVTEEAMGAAMKKGMETLQAFRESMRDMGKKQLAAINPDEKVFVLISKVYGIVDPGLNMGIPEKLESMGYKVIPCFMLPEEDIFDDHPNMFWPFGQHIVGSAMGVKKHPNMHAIFLTHHGCGPDSVTSHYVKEIMGDRPYLNIEVDEHSSDVGVITRVEAFVNSLDNSPSAQSAAPVAQPLVGRASGLHDAPVLVPRLFPYSSIGVEMLRAGGVDAHEFDPTSRMSLDLGRKNAGGNEYFSLVALLGDALRAVRRFDASDKAVTVLLPQNEGTEVDGQFGRFLETKFGQTGMKNVSMLMPFLEDMLSLETYSAESVFLCLLAGDLILLSPAGSRNSVLETVLGAVRNGELSHVFLQKLARSITEMVDERAGGKRFFAIGEPAVLFNDVLNDHTLSSLEDADHTVMYAPLSEYVWTLWSDYLHQNSVEKGEALRQRLDRFGQYIVGIGAILGKRGHFEQDMADLEAAADETVGLYAGAFGRYRAGKIMNGLPDVNGVIAVSSMYENTGISLEILQKGLKERIGRPFLSLTFDGNSNKNDATRLDSFLYYS